MYELYEQILAAYKSGDERRIAGAAINWLSASAEDPFAQEEARELYFKAKRFYLKYKAAGIDMRSSRRNMISYVKQIAALNLPNPYKKEEPKIIENKPEPKVEKKTETKKEIKTEISKEELNDDVKYLLTNMVSAYNAGNETSYEMYVTHMMDIVEENPFVLGTDEYELFSTMVATYRRNPPNKRRTFVVGKQLCELINNTELYPEKIQKPKQTILGVLPDEEKKSWRQFLFPWKKDGEQDDSSRTD